ncbi:uncharacterized protein LOC110099625 [Dendrobium catenatum]|uniref:uncharacterized protein LOC110099625 n=1 Tax=Dendrobium catenatum TaxID=906689 RepID=UPI0009F251E7|nr:uncharacterized protein LOC110099625 [Dendrobium catenatum]
MESSRRMGILENLLRQKSLKALFGGRKDNTDAEVTNPIPQLSPIANSVVFRCSKVLHILTEKLQQCFETELPDHAFPPSLYARNLLEYCSYKALNVMIKCLDHMADKDFYRLTFDMMLAWEAPGTGTESLLKESFSTSHPRDDDEDGESLFYINSTNVAVQVDEKKSVGLEAFARVAPACPSIADLITVHNLFDALTSSSDGRLHFIIYEKYLKSINKVLKASKGHIGSTLSSSLHLADGEIILDVAGVIPTQPVLQHIGISIWPGRLTLTNYALYFESLGVGSHDKAVVYDLAMDSEQIVKPELTGPLGARLFDKAVLFKSTNVTDPVYFEFPELKGHSRRDYWLSIVQEVLHAHRFIRKYNLAGIQREEALSKATIGIFRYRALREAFRTSLSDFKSILAFNLAEKLPKGDMILEALSNHLELLQARSKTQNCIELKSDISPHVLSVSSYMLVIMGFISLEKLERKGENNFSIPLITVGETTSLELAVKESYCHSGSVEAANATVDQVKMEGIGTNFAVMQELLHPMIEVGKLLVILAEWEDRLKSSAFIALLIYVTYRDWIKYIFPSIFFYLAVLMLWNKYRKKIQRMKAFQVTPPPSKNAVEQLLTLQEAISQLEAYIQTGNVVLLKLRSLLLAAAPQATDRVVIAMIVMALAIAFLPFKLLVELMLLDAFTQEMPLRKKSNDKIKRRVKEWWDRIPAAPVRLLRPSTGKHQN